MNLFIYFIEPIFMTLLVFCKVRKCFFGDTFINEGQNVYVAVAADCDTALSLCICDWRSYRLYQWV